MNVSFRNIVFVSGIVALAFEGDAACPAQSPTRPNILYVLCDDLGYGDVHCLNPDRGKIATPNIDRLGQQGLIFTDAHGGSSVCTPTRYGILTGRYCWRSRLQRYVLEGNDLPLIAPGRLTVAALLKRHGYTTACIGKWHLGIQYSPRPPAVPGRMGEGPLLRTVPRVRSAVSPRLSGEGQGVRAFTEPILDGPVQHGFDYFFGVSASLDMPPFAFIENDRFTEALTVQKKWIRNGPAAKHFEAIDVLPTLTRKAVEYIAGRAAAAKTGTPFFLYLALTSPHTPILPTKQFDGKSGLGKYGDFVMETDWALGQVLEALDKAGAADNTLVVFTSDNGCSPAAGIPALERLGHYPSAVYRGYKADIWDGGHRIPFIVRWPGKVKAGLRSEQLTCLTDLLATCAEMLGDKLPDNAGEDSVSILPALLGTVRAPLREAVVHHSINGMFAIRQANWKLEFCPGSGGWGRPGDPQAWKQGLPAIQLYDMTRDVGERTNEQARHPEIVRRLSKLLETYVAQGRSTPGAAQKNDVPVDIWKVKPPVRDTEGKVLTCD